MSGDLHKEAQSLPLWVHALILGALGSSAITVAFLPADAGRWWIIIPILIGVGVYTVFNPMTVEVDGEAMHVRFGQFGWPRWIFPIDQIEDARVVTFRPLRDYGGWGIRRGEEGYCLNERGDSGVRFEHVGNTYTVGSDDPERLLEILRTAGADIAEA